MFLAKLIKYINTKDLGTGAAGMAFFLFLSIIPIITLLSYIFPLCGIESQNVVELITEITPDYVDSLVTQLINEVYDRSSRVLPLSLIFLFWTAASSIVSTVSNLKKVYEVEEKKGFILMHLSAIVYTLFLLIVITAALIYFIVRNKILSWIELQTLPAPVYALLSFHWNFILALPLWTILLTLLYNRISSHSKKSHAFRNFPGALFVYIVWYVFTRLFEKYLSFVDNYTVFYGSMASLAVFLIWLYVSCYILLLGGCINCVWAGSARHTKK